MERGSSLINTNSLETPGATRSNISNSRTDSSVVSRRHSRLKSISKSHAAGLMRIPCITGSPHQHRTHTRAAAGSQIIQVHMHAGPTPCSNPAAYLFPDLDPSTRGCPYIRHAPLLRRTNCGSCWHVLYLVAADRI
jgi:hypothetical protein